MAMRIQLTSSDLNSGMSTVSRALSARPTNAAYEGVLMETADNGVLLTCTDGEMTIKTTVPAIIEEEGCALLPAKLLGDLAHRLEGMVTIKLDDGGRATITAPFSSTRMVALEAADFPDIKDVKGDNVTTLPADQMRRAVDRVLFALSTDDSRKILTGCLMETCREEVRFVALDGFRLGLQRIVAVHDLPQGQDSRSTVIPGRVISEICKILPDENIPVSFHCTASQLMLCFGGTRVYSTLLTGEYINYRQILPTAWLTSVKIRRDLFADAIERAGLIAREGKNNLLRLHIDESGMHITANAEMGNANEEIEIDFEGAALDIAFNARYLSDVIRCLDCDEVCMRFNSNVSPCIICPVTGEQFVYLVLPVRVFGS